MDLFVEMLRMFEVVTFTKYTFVVQFASQMYLTTSVTEGMVSGSYTHIHTHACIHTWWCVSINVCLSTFWRLGALTKYAFTSTES